MVTLQKKTVLKLLSEVGLVHPHRGVNVNTCSGARGCCMATSIKPGAPGGARQQVSFLAASLGWASTSNAPARRWARPGERLSLPS